MKMTDEQVTRIVNAISNINLTPENTEEVTALIESWARFLHYDGDWASRIGLVNGERKKLFLSSTVDETYAQAKDNNGVFSESGRAPLNTVPNYNDINIVYDTLKAMIDNIDTTGGDSGSSGSSVTFSDLYSRLCWAVESANRARVSSGGIAAVSTTDAVSTTSKPTGRFIWNYILRWIFDMARGTSEERFQNYEKTSSNVVNDSEVGYWQRAIQELRLDDNFDYSGLAQWFGEHQGNSIALQQSNSSANLVVFHVTAMTPYNKSSSAIGWNNVAHTSPWGNTGLNIRIEGKITYCDLDTNEYALYYVNPDANSKSYVSAHGMIGQDIVLFADGTATAEYGGLFFGKMPSSNDMNLKVRW